MTYTILIADDEIPARQRMREILSAFSEIEIVGETANGDETVAQTNLLKPDVLFLDIQMPGQNGFEVLKNLTHLPIVIFCTAYDNYALEAFSTNAIDYIVKPIKKERVGQSIGKIRSFKGNTNKGEMIRVLEQISRQHEQRTLTNIPVKVGDKILFIRLSEICYFSAEEKYVAILKNTGQKYLTDHSLKHLEEKLPGNFIRIHRSVLLNSDYIREIDKYFGSRFAIRLNDKNQTKLISGRNYFERIKLLTEF